MKEKLFRDVVALYASEENPEWRRLARRSKEIYRAGLKSLEQYNMLPVAKFTRPMVIELRDSLYDSPGRCRVALTTLSNVLRYAHDRGWIEYNHALNVRGMPPKKEFEGWSTEEIDHFMKNSPERLQRAAALALYTGQRRSDLVKMVWDDYDGEYIQVFQQKTGKRLWIPVHKRLKEVLDRVPEKERKRGRFGFILLNKHGQRYVGDSLSLAFNRQNKKIGARSGLTVHGLRKSAAAFLAEAGCSPHQIASITGHTSLRMIEHYTKSARQKQMATTAMEAWK